MVYIWEFTVLFSLLLCMFEVFYNIKFFESVMEPAGRSIGPGVRAPAFVNTFRSYWQGSCWACQRSWMKTGCDGSLESPYCRGLQEPGGNLPWMEAPKESPVRAE